MDLKKLTIEELQKMLKQKQVSSQELTQAYIKQIEEKDKKIGAYISYNFDKALDKAKQADEKIAKGENLSSLTGIPCGIKDNISTRGIKTTCASKMLENYVPPYNAHVMDKLENCDAVMLGKLNMDEFAMGSTTENSYFKVTKNPRDTQCVPGGSSGGSAAAIAADEAVYTLGSDTGGSIRQPASFCGVVGMKPTYGAVSRNGLVAFASSLDQIGPLTKNVKDNAIVLNEIVGYDKNDSTSVNRVYKNFVENIDSGVKGMRIAMPKEYFAKGISDDVKDSVLEAAKVYESLGAHVTEVSIPSLDLALAAYYVISSAEASSNLARFDGIRYGFRADSYDNLEELYKKSRSEGFGKEVKRRIMLGSFALSSGYYDAYYKKALQVRTLLMSDFASIFEKYDFILSPVAPTTAYKIGEKSESPLEMYMGDIFTVPVNIAGLPSLAVPHKDTSSGLPTGIQLIGKAFSEATLYKAGFAFEQSVGAYHLNKI